MGAHDDPGQGDQHCPDKAHEKQCRLFALQLCAELGKQAQQHQSGCIGRVAGGEAQEEYLRLLRSCPSISADRFAWLLASDERLICLFPESTKKDVRNREKPVPDFLY